ncbi:MAG TPA: hypothetical protein VN026_02015 [Bacteroidia bacterium]|jgi:hypothetical protein|nr:hypothetical protein [Bacteroidia bacterium]
MKKSIALLALAFGVTGAFAQDLTSKKGEPILPEAGDWAVSVEATPFLQYMGNFFGKTTTNSAPTWNNYGANQSIMVKKFTDAQNAYRATFRIGLRDQSFKNEIAAPQATTASPVNFPNKVNTVQDKASHTSSFIGIGVGMEKRKGKTRLQGFYGADVFVWYSSSKDKFTYGNALSPAATADPRIVPTATNTTDWNTVAPGTFSTSNIGVSIPNQPGVTNTRKTIEKPGGQFGLGVRAFIGAEYFVLPKISIGGEFGWGIGLALNTKAKTTYETVGVDGGGAFVTSTITNTQKRGMQMILDTDNNPANNSNYNLALSPTGTLRINFHF